jgi:phosphoglycerol transferase MdoB-like AlkP superfamily enzyme
LQLDNNLTEDIMVIQRWQSVWLLVSAICVALFCFLPMATLSFDGAEAAKMSLDAAGAATGGAGCLEAATVVTPSDNIVVMIVGLLTAALLIINIFSFKDTRRQKRMTVLSILLMVVLGACAVLMVYGTDTAAAQVEWMGSLLLLVGAAAFAVLAHRCITHDEKLLKAADRLR